jgi:RNA polymerase sigma-70 factor (ECF subfamily)
MMNLWEKTKMEQVGGGFPSTHWSLILNARTQDETRRRLATESLIAGYWKPVYCYLRRRGCRNEEAEDLTQDFFCRFFIGAKLLRTADRQVGRFRQLLLTALKRFVNNVKRDKNRRKRTPSKGIISLSSPQLEGVDLPDSAATPEQAFYYAWITDLLDQVLAEVKEQYNNSGMATHWDVFQLKVLAPILQNAQSLSMRQICERCGVATEVQGANMLIVVKRRFQAVLRRRLRNLVRSDSETEAEFKELFQFLSGGRRRLAGFSVNDDIDG